MRAIERLIPDSARDAINANPIAKWGAAILMLFVGLLLAIVGLNAIKTKKLTGKNGKVFEGSTAQVLGVLYVVFGVAFAIAPLVVAISA